MVLVLVLVLAVVVAVLAVLAPTVLELRAAMVVRHQQITTQVLPFRIRVVVVVVVQQAAQVGQMLETEIQQRQQQA